MSHPALRALLFVCFFAGPLHAATAADAASATVAPASVPVQKPPPSVKLTLDAPPATGKELTTATQVDVAGRTVVPASKDASSVTFTPPQLDTAGPVAVAAKNATGDVLAAAELRYGDACSGDECGKQKSNLAVFYALVILGFPFVLMMSDLLKAYGFAQRTRALVIDRAARDGLSIDELKLLLTELGRSPPGIPGLARNSIAFMLMMILGVAIVHLLVVAPPTAKIPDVVDRVLVLLTGLLTSIVSFYFGSRASETTRPTTEGTRAQPQSPAGVTLAPKSGKPRDSVKISGAGFGTEKGEVKFGDVAADMSDASWSDTEVTVKVPTDAKPGKVRVTVTPKGGQRPLTSTDEFEVLGAAEETAPSTDENEIDGCDVAITDATPDTDLPPAEGGVEK